MLRRLNRNRKLGVAEDAVLAINALLRRLDTAADVAALLGFEGQGAARYWPALAAQIDGEWGFEGRRRRPIR